MVVIEVGDCSHCQDPLMFDHGRLLSSPVNVPANANNRFNGIEKP